MSAIACEHLSKDFGSRRAVDDVSFVAPPGCVTGFVGANGAGKTTTIRMVLGLVEPSAGRALVDGRRYGELDAPRATVGAVLDVPGAHPGHSGRAHLQIIAAAAGIARRRTDAMLELVGLAEHAGRRVGAYSLGMRQRLSLAAALLGDPSVLVLDEPTKGLDPPGIRWFHSMLRALADQGRCVLISSHHLAELESIADRVVIIADGRLVAAARTGDLLRDGRPTVSVLSTAPHDLARLLRAEGADVTARAEGELAVSGLGADRIGAVATAAGIPLRRLAEERLDLEDVFFRLAEGKEQRLAPDRPQ
jgi:ABC-2 type transport system ATP-binding protein